MKSAFRLRDMMPNVGKKSFFTVFFSLYFLSYAASPLSLIVDEKPCIGNVSPDSEAPSFAHSLHIFLWELICSNFSEEKDAASNHDEVKILIKKARAIVPQKVFVKSLSSGKNAAAIEFCFLLFFLTASRLQHRHLSEASRGLSCLCSSRSPPFAV